MKKKLVQITAILVFLFVCGSNIVFGEDAVRPVIAHFHLTGTLIETPMEDPFNLSGQEMLSLKDLLKRLKNAREDEEVKAVVLTFDRMSMGLGQLEEVRGAINKFKSANKEVYIHAEGLNTFIYALLSSASHLSVAPQSSVWITGIYGESLYVRGLLDKIGVESDFLQIGDYKSAAEMVTRSGPSPAAKENINWLLDGIYESLVSMIAESRGMKPDQVRKIIDNGPYIAEEAVKLGLIDSVKDRKAFVDEIKNKFGVEAKIANRYGADKGMEVNLANPFAFFSIFSGLGSRYKKTAENSIGLIFVEGMIIPGYAQPDPFGNTNAAYSGNISKALEKAAKDDSVKAVVLRVDSPGGSAEASEVILNATKLIKGKKPLIVSMGNIAGSGGYYVSCAADTIFADETTITASIGVIGGKFVTTRMWDKIGVNWVGYKRGESSDILSSAERFNDKQREKIHGYMNKVYNTFVGHVTSNRGNKLSKPIEEIAGGRVYTGKQAMELNLVDQI
ncbi:MAG: signal peptide peptidase SppA, partial [Planctomycetota bacterium]